MLTLFCLIVLGIFAAACHFPRLLLNQFVCRQLSDFLGQEVEVGRVGINSYRRFRLENVRVDNEHISLAVREVFIDIVLNPSGKIDVESITLHNPLFLLRKIKKDVLPPNKISFPLTFPAIIINQGRFVMEGAETSMFGRRKIINIDYLKFTGFISTSGFDTKIFTNLRFSGVTGKKFPIALKGKFHITGKCGEGISDSKMRAGLYLSKLCLGNLEIRELRTNAKLAMNKLTLTDIACELCSGMLTGLAQTDFNKNEYSFECNISDMSLDKLIKSEVFRLRGKGSKISGEIDLQLKLAGKGKDWRKLSGNGCVRVKDGQLWQIPVFYGLSTLILKPASRGTVFKEGNADFKIADGILETENLKFMGEDIGLSAAGTVQFGGKLDFAVTTVFDREFMSKTSGLIEITSALSKILDFFIVQHHIGGTLSKPSYNVIPLPVITTIPLHIKKILRALFPGKSRRIP